MAKPSRFDEHLAIIVNDPTTTTYQYGVGMLDEEPHLDHQAVRKEEVILTYNLHELAGRSLYPSTPVGRKVKRFGGIWEEANPRIGEGPDNLDTAVCRILIGDHDL